MEITLFEVHFPNAEFNAPFARGADDVTERPSGVSIADRAPSSLGPVAALAALVGVVLLTRYLRGSDAEQTTLDEVAA